MNQGDTAVLRKSEHRHRRGLGAQGLDLVRIPWDAFRQVDKAVLGNEHIVFNPDADSQKFLGIVNSFVAQIMHCARATQPQPHT